MKNKRENINIIERYLDGLLDADEKKQFEEKLERNSDLKCQYEERLKIAELWNLGMEYNEIKKQLKKNIIKGEQRKRNYKNYYLSAAAVLIFLIGTYFTLMLTKKSPDINHDFANENITDTIITDTTGCQEIILKMDKIELKASSDSIH